MAYIALVLFCLLVMDLEDVEADISVAWGKFIFLVRFYTAFYKNEIVVVTKISKLLKTMKNFQKDIDIYKTWNYYNTL